MTKHIITIQWWRFCPVCMDRTQHIKTADGWKCEHELRQVTTTTESGNRRAEVQAHEARSE